MGAGVGEEQREPALVLLPDGSAELVQEPGQVAKVLDAFPRHVLHESHNSASPRNCLHRNSLLRSGHTYTVSKSSPSTTTSHVSITTRASDHSTRGSSNNSSSNGLNFGMENPLERTLGTPAAEACHMHVSREVCDTTPTARPSSLLSRAPLPEVYGSCGRARNRSWDDNRGMPTVTHLSDSSTTSAVRHLSDPNAMSCAAGAAHGNPLPQVNLQSELPLLCSRAPTPPTSQCPLLPPVNLQSEPPTIFLRAPTFPPSRCPLPPQAILEPELPTDLSRAVLSLPSQCPRPRPQIPPKSPPPGRPSPVGSSLPLDPELSYPPVSETSRPKVVLSSGPCPPQDRAMRRASSSGKARMVKGSQAPLGAPSPLPAPLADPGAARSKQGPAVLSWLKERLRKSRGTPHPFLGLGAASTPNLTTSPLDVDLDLTHSYPVKSTGQGAVGFSAPRSDLRHLGVQGRNSSSRPERESLESRAGGSPPAARPVQRLILHNEAGRTCYSVQAADDACVRDLRPFARPMHGFQGARQVGSGGSHLQILKDHQVGLGGGPHNLEEAWRMDALPWASQDPRALLFEARQVSSYSRGSQVVAGGAGAVSSRCFTQEPRSEWSVSPAHVWGSTLEAQRTMRNSNVQGSPVDLPAEVLQRSFTDSRLVRG